MRKAFRFYLYSALVAVSAFALALIGGIGGLIVAGQLIDSGWSYGTVMLVLASAQLIVTIIVVTSYPETAHTELEDLNPEDAPLTIQ